MTSLKTRTRLTAGKGYKSAHRWLGRLASRLRSPYSRVYYVVEGRDWSIDWDGQYITSNVREQTGVPCLTTRRYQGITNQVVHFGSRNIFLGGGFRELDPSNRAVFTWFHGNEADPTPENKAMIRALPDAAPHAQIVVTSSTIARGRLIGWGVPESKIVVIPLGIDLKVFRPAIAAKKERMRERLGIPGDAVCIGSFQKDGVGWGDGSQPKLIKGPDIFLKAIEILASKHRLFVLLTGPARGYVKKGLEEMDVPYFHAYLKNYHDIVSYFHSLDLYLVTSRDEGGPKAILECMATGVPIISTRVGMAQDVIRTGENGVVTEVEDCEALAFAASELAENAALRERLMTNGLATAAGYDWSAVAAQYYERVYRPLLKLD